MTPSTIRWVCNPETLKHFDNTNISIKSGNLLNQAGLFFDKLTPTNGSFLYFVDPTSQRYKYITWASIKHKQSAKTEIEKLKLETLSIDQAVKEASKILFTLREEEGCDKNYRLDMG